ncbi:MAG: hypothetical protein WCR68_01625 [Candidatus Dojkabacteria bacterium]
MKKSTKNFFKRGLFVTIGGQVVDFPIVEKWKDLDEVILDVKDIINAFIMFSSVVAVAMIIVSGYTLITAMGNPDKIEQGQKTLTAAIIGLIVVWIAGLIIKFVLTLLEVG